MRRPLVLVAACALACVAPLLAAQAVKEAEPGLRKQATLSADSARKIALARVPGARVQSAELEREKDRLVYSIDLATKGKPGIDEVLVDAKTGDVVSVEHETPAREKAERAAEVKEGKARKGATSAAPAAKPPRSPGAR